MFRSTVSTFADSRGVGLVLEQAGLQGVVSVVVRRIGERGHPIRNGDRVGQTDHFRQIFGVTEIELLAIEIAEGGMGFHDDARLGAVDART